MPRTAIPFVAGDISALAKSLRSQLASSAAAPGHVEMLNMLARAVGARNFQQLRAAAEAEGRVELAAPEPVDLARVTRVAGQFDDQGRLVRWPAKPSHQALALWGLWAALPAEQTFDERSISARLDQRHLFGDAAILRRSMVHAGLLWRTSDGRIYRRVERAPTPEALALIRRLKGLRGG